MNKEFMFIDVGASSTIPSLADLCAALQHATLVHMAKRLYRAFLFCEMRDLLPTENRTLVSHNTTVTVIPRF